MALMVLAGSKISISGEPMEFLGDALSVDSFDSVDWRLISSAESLGMVGVAWNTAETVRALHDPDTPWQSVSEKTYLQPQEMKMQLGVDLADPGQVTLWQAAGGFGDYAFRLDFPDAPPGGSPTRRMWVASVTALQEVYDQAAAVMRLQASLIVNSNVVRVASSAGAGG